MNLHDALAFAMTFCLLAGILLLICLGKVVPDYLITSFVGALAWAFRGSIESGIKLGKPQ